MDDADPRAKLEPFQALIGEWTIEMTHPIVEDTVVTEAELGWRGVLGLTRPFEHSLLRLCQRVAISL